MMHGDPTGPASDVQHGVEDWPIRDGVGTVLHGLRLAVRRGYASSIKVVSSYDDGRRDGSVRDELVEAEAGPVALAGPEPADARGEALEVDFFSRFGDPTPQTLV